MAVTTIVASLTWSPGAAAGAKRCPAFVPNIPDDQRAADSALRVTEKATESSPVVTEFVHDPGVGALLVRQAADVKRFGLQVEGEGLLHVRTEWATPAPDEIDLFLFDAFGETIITGSDGYNVPVDNESWETSHSGMGYEHIAGWPVGRCARFIIESEALRSPGCDMVLKLWLTQD